MVGIYLCREHRGKWPKPWPTSAHSLLGRWPVRDDEGWGCARSAAMHSSGLSNMPLVQWGLETCDNIWLMGEGKKMFQAGWSISAKQWLPTALSVPRGMRARPSAHSLQATPNPFSIHVRAMGPRCKYSFLARATQSWLAGCPLRGHIWHPAHPSYCITLPELCDAVRGIRAYMSYVHSHTPHCASSFMMQGWVYLVHCGSSSNQ